MFAWAKNTRDVRLVKHEVVMRQSKVSMACLQRTPSTSTPITCRAEFSRHTCIHGFPSPAPISKKVDLESRLALHSKPSTMRCILKRGISPYLKPELPPSPAGCSVCTSSYASEVALGSLIENALGQFVEANRVLPACVLSALLHCRLIFI